MSRKPKARKPKADITIQAKDEAEKEKKIAELYIAPHVLSANTLIQLSQGEGLELVPMAEALQGFAEKIAKGDLGQVEVMLAVQLQILHTIFLKATNRMATADYIPQYQAYGAVALKAQNLTRMTAATLAEMKHPVQPTVIKNTAYHQQVNLGQSAEKSPNELLSTPQLEHHHHAEMDTGGTPAAGGIDQDMETVGTRRR